MFNFRHFTFLFFIILLGLNLVVIFPWNDATGWFTNVKIWTDSHSLWLYITLFISYFGISVSLAFLPCSNFHHEVICKTETFEKIISITFDDGPHPINTPLILEILKNKKVPAAFFCLGKNLAGNEKIIKQMIGQGHIIGNHSFSHSKWFDFYSSRKIRSELLETDRLIGGITGKTPAYFRPPFGVINPLVSKALQGFNRDVVGWNIRSLDTITRNPDKITNRIISSLKPGSIILLHDHTDFSMEHLDELLSKIFQSGYSIVPLNQLINKQAYA
jgi:peptidoglycan/xylan/chitin deacetylase (PgdA/CDA1 family)